MLTAGVLTAVKFLDNESAPSENDIKNNSGKTLDKNADANVNRALVNAAAAPLLPSLANSIKIRIKTTARELSVTSIADGKIATVTVNPELERTIEASESVSLSYYQGFADSVTLFVNGKKSKHLCHRQIIGKTLLNT